MRIEARYKSLKSKLKTAGFIYRNDGMQGIFLYIRNGVSKRVRRLKQDENILTGDVLMITINQPLLDRYRTDHMMEQFKSVGIKADKVYYFHLTEDYIRRYNTFIFYRCPWIPEFENFFKEVRKRNKVLVYAVDDLVVDKKYTDTIPSVQQMSDTDREVYDNGVLGYKKMLENCDYALATTTDLASELLATFSNLKEVFVTRNVMSEEMVLCANEAIQESKKEDDKIVIGYFSGSMTHNEDFEMIAPAIVRLLETDHRVYIKLAGRVETPIELQGYEDRIIFTPYVDWRKLPHELRQCDIILAPLVDTLFNRAKSEIKWSEAALVGVPVVASNMGSFKEVIEHGKTGFLVNNSSSDWFDGMYALVSDNDLRQRIARGARNYVIHNCRTVGKNALELKRIIEKITPVVVGFSGVNMGAISGGNIVIKKHMDILRRAGYIVYGVEVMEYREDDKWLAGNLEDDTKYDIFRIKSHRKADKVDLKISFDILVATFWQSVDMVTRYAYMNKNSKKLYLIQNMEADFYKELDPVRLEALATYCNPQLEPITISRWCQSWLKSIYGRSAAYAPNGLAINNFQYSERDMRSSRSKKIKILIEGDSASDYKRVDESFTITNQLDARKFEISYMSYNALPKKWYRTDYIYRKISPKDVGAIYAEHDILLKSSILESFSYPPLEMMATGGLVVLVKNDGNAEYIEDGVNSLCYESGDIDAAINKINSIISAPKEFRLITKNARQTAMRYEWDSIQQEVVKLYSN